jgi:circadian clock protein KaiC
LHGGGDYVPSGRPRKGGAGTPGGEAVLARSEDILQRLPTGTDSLDTILDGGFFKGGLYVIEGTPGAGKTILANQICFRHAAQNGRAVFVTLLAESHSRMLQHMRTLSFFDEAVIPSALVYVSGFAAMERDGLNGIVEMVHREITRHNATLLVIDGFSIAEQLAVSERQFKKFVHDLQSQAAAADCTVLLLVDGGRRQAQLEYVMVDGILQLEDILFDHRTERNLQVVKFRGSSYLRGRHPFRITDDGIVAYPRIEAVYAVPPVRDRYRPLRIATGIDGFDTMLRGGLPSETSNAVYGPTGSGKTTFGLQYVSLSSKLEPGLFFGMYETPERLRVKAAALGIDLEGLEDRGDLQIIWRPQGELILDDIAHQVIETVRARGVRRLFIDGFGGLLESSVAPDRLSLFISTFSNTLRALNATTVLTMEARDILGSEMILPAYGLSSLLEGLIVLRYAEVRGRVHRILSITKIRDSDFDSLLHDVTMTDRGMVVGAPMRGLEALLSGFAREPKAGDPDVP